MSRSVSICVLCVIGVVVSTGCTQFGILPGPSPSLLLNLVSSNASALSSLFGGTDLSGLGLSGLSGLSGLTGTTSAGSQSCPAGTTWVGTATVNGQSVAINACVSTALAGQYGM